MDNTGGTDYSCSHCGYTGPCYGALIGDQVSAPWCNKCGLNNTLTPIAERSKNE